MVNLQRQFSDFPDTRHIFKLLLNAVLYFHELKNQRNVNPQSLVRFSIFCKVWFQFLISQRIFPKRIFSKKFGFSFPLSRKIFRLQFPLIFLRKNRSEALCVSSENILHLTFRGLKMWRKPTPSLYKYNQNFKLNNCAISKNTRNQPYF